MFNLFKSKEEKYLNKLSNRFDGDVAPSEEWFFLKFMCQIKGQWEQRVYPKCKFQIENGYMKIEFLWEDGSPGTFNLPEYRYKNLTVKKHDPQKLRK